MNSFHCEGSAPGRQLSLTAPRPLGLWDHYGINSVMNIGRDHRERNPEYMRTNFVKIVLDT